MGRAINALLKVGRSDRTRAVQAIRRLSSSWMASATTSEGPGQSRDRPCGKLVGLPHFAWFRHLIKFLGTMITLKTVGGYPTLKNGRWLHKSNRVFR